MKFHEAVRHTKELLLNRLLGEDTRLTIALSRNTAADDEISWMLAERTAHAGRGAPNCRGMPSIVATKPLMPYTLANRSKSAIGPKGRKETRRTSDKISNVVNWVSTQN